MVANEETVVVELFNPNEIVQELTEYICTLLEENEAEQFRNTCGTLAGQGNLLELINVFYEQLAKHLNEESSIRFAIVFSLMRRLDPETLGMVVERICTDMTSSEEQAEVRLEVLQELYSILPFTSRARYTIFMARLQYSARTGLEAQALAHLTTADVKPLIQAWELNKLEEKQLYVALCDSLAKAEVEGLDPQQVLISFLETFESSTVEELASVNDYAQRAVIGTINKAITVTKDPTKNTGEPKIAAETYHLSAVQSLKNSTSESHRRAYALLTIFCEGDCAQFREFCAKYPGQLGEFGLDEQVCVDNIRLLSLASLSAEDESVSYARVAELLSIEMSEVEQWVVKAITSKVIDAKLDQLNQVIIVNRGSQRHFTDTQWADLGEKLKKWRGSVQTVLQSVRKAREDHDKMTAAYVR